MFNYLHSIRWAHSKASNLLWRFTIHPHQLNNKFCLISRRHPHWSCLNTGKTEKIIASYIVQIHMLMLIFRIHNNNLPTEIYHTRHWGHHAGKQYLLAFSKYTKPLVISFFCVWLHFFFIIIVFFFLFFKFYFIFKLYIIVLVLPNIKMISQLVIS